MGMAILLPGRTGYGKTPTGRVYARRSVSTSQRAVRKSRPSPWRGPTSCTPSGRPLAPLMSGTLRAGTALVPLAGQVDRHLGLHDEAVPVPRLLDGAGQLDLLHAVAEALDQLGEGLLRVGVHAIPVRRFHESEGRRDRRLLGGRRAVRRVRTGARLELALVVGDARLQQQRHVLDGAREETDGVQRLRDARHAPAGAQPARRLQPVD